MEMKPRYTQPPGNAPSAPEEAARIEVEQVRKAPTYMILVAEQYDDLEKQVNDAILGGWMPLGGVSDYEVHCAQAMMKEYWPPTPPEMVAAINSIL